MVGGFIVANYIPIVYIADVCLEHEWHKSLFLIIKLNYLTINSMNEGPSWEDNRNSKTN
jgi:hypothetical protein